MTEGVEERTPDAYDVTCERVMAAVSEKDASPPTDYCMDTTLLLLTNVAAQLYEEFPEASASTDGTGGLSLFWRSRYQDVQVRVPPSPDVKEPGFIRIRNGNDYRVTNDISANKLVETLRWFIKKRQPWATTNKKGGA